MQFIPDTYWIKFAGFEPEGYLDKLSARVSTLHLKDYRKTLGLPLFRALGKGVLDFGKIINCAQRNGVKNSVVELDFAPNPYKSVEFGMRYLNNLKI